MEGSLEVPHRATGLRPRSARTVGRVAGLVAALALGLGCASGDLAPERGATALATRLTFERPFMGTTFVIVITGVDHARAERAADAAFAAVAAVEGWASDWSASSEVRELTLRAEALPPGAALEVSAPLAQHLAFALDVARRTAGAFDPTLGAFTRLWRRSARLGELPSRARLAEARAVSGFEHVVVDAAARSVRIARPGLRFDLGGSAKGEALDAAYGVLVAHGCARSLVDGGGDLRLGEPPEGEAGWRVELRPLGPDGPLWRGLLARCAVATSGSSAQRFELDGVAYAHVVDPATGLGLTTSRGASVIAPDGRTADALATAMVVGGDDVLALCEAWDGVAAALFEPGTGPFPACATSDFPHDGGPHPPRSAAPSTPDDHDTSREFRDPFPP